MKSYKKIIASGALSLSLAMLLAAFTPIGAIFEGEDAASVGSFAKTELSASEIKFTRHDFIDHTKGEEVLSGIVLTSIPASEQGTLVLNGLPCDIGQNIELSQLDALVFTPKTDGELSAKLEFIPIFEKSGAAAASSAVSLNFAQTKNSAPIALDLSFETYVDLSLYGILKHIDLENESCVYQIDNAPKKGSVVIDNQTFSYTPSGKSGKDSFTYTATDPSGNVSKSATVEITISKRPERSVTYTDMAESTVHFEAIKLSEAGVLTGECLGSNSFLNPQKTVSRAEFTALAASVAQLPAPTMAVSTGMSDDDAIPTWAQPYISSALNFGIVSGERGSEGNHSFRPADPITRAEAAKIVSRICGAFPSSRCTFLDSAAIPTWAVPDVSAAQAAGLVDALPDGSFGAQQTVTREDAVKMLYNAMNYMQKHEKSGISNMFD